MHHLFIDGITAMDVAEHLVAFDDDRAIHDIREFLDVRGLHIAGVPPSSSSPTRWGTAR
jgi:hypothetical protein